VVRAGAHEDRREGWGDSEADDPADDPEDDGGRQEGSEQRDQEGDGKPSEGLSCSAPHLMVSGAGVEPGTDRTSCGKRAQARCRLDAVLFEHLGHHLRCLGG
jgi:hypothetical protein